MPRYCVCFTPSRSGLPQMKARRQYMHAITAASDTIAAPRTTQHKRGIRFWTVRVLLGLLLLICGLALAGAIYQALATASDRRTYPPPGQLIDVGGYKLHIHCLGAGSPTVILDAANSGTVSNWAWIQPQIAKATRVCAYDRAGLGWSDLSPEPQDTRQNAEALHTLLRNADVPGPYVLVGHSFGGLYVRMFAERFPDEVVGLVLIEGTLPDGLQRLGKPDVMPNAPDEGIIDLMPLISQLGLVRLRGFPPSDADLPERQFSELQAYLASTKWAELIKRQYHLFPTLLAQVRPLFGAGSLGDRPLAVVLGSDGDGGLKEWQDLFGQQAMLSTNSTLRVVDGANHLSLVDRREHALQTSAIILQVVEAARTGEPLQR
jgi:pimeloyl-ACP methyl ester carboxylesterase